MKLLEQGMQTTDFHQHIDLFYYIEVNMKMKLLVRALRESLNPDLAIFKELKGIYAEFRVRWNADYKYLVTPQWMHAGFK